jgi:transcriptional regulator of acetoin/glycerol metabolism
MEELLEQPEENVEYLEQNHDEENYVNESKRSSYSQSNLDKAVLAVESKEITMYAAAKMYSIPRSTLFNRLKAKKTNPVGRVTRRRITA